MERTKIWMWGLLTFAVSGCGSDDIPTDPLIQERPYEMHVPASYDKATPTPLVMALHGRPGTGEVIAELLNLIAGSESHGYLAVYPDGRLGPDGLRFWTATDANWNVPGMPDVDSVYIEAVIDDVIKRYNVDTQRIYVVGVSNGGFMAHRLACDIGDRLAAIISVAGMTWADPAKCPAPAPVHVLQIHGDADMTVKPAGGQYMDMVPYPSLTATIDEWALKNGCTGTLSDTGRIDFERTLAGDETRQQEVTGCPAGGSVSLWTVEGGTHMLAPVTALPQIIWSYLDAHQATAK
jgi:polyhydroxybutyrate depolymerase